MYTGVETYISMPHVSEHISRMISMFARGYHAETFLSAVLSRNIAFSRSCMEAA